MRGPALSVVLVAIAADSCGVGAAGQFDRLGVRNAHAMAYDPVGARVVLFGGADTDRVHGDTWMYRGRPGGWELVSDGGPDPRTFPAMTFDAARGAIVLVGGNRVLFGRQTDRDTFSRRHVAADGAELEPGSRCRAGPSRRSGDGVRRRAPAHRALRRLSPVAVGRRASGRHLGVGRPAVGTSRHGRPAARNGGSLAYDEASGRIVLVGGPPRAVPPETWSWDGASWTVQPGPHPPARFNAVLVYHAGLAALLRFGGWTGTERAGDTWARLPAGWTDLRQTGPAARNHAAMAYDQRRGRAVLFGGHDGDLVFGGHVGV